MDSVQLPIAEPPNRNSVLVNGVAMLQICVGASIKSPFIAACDAHLNPFSSLVWLFGQQGQEGHVAQQDF
jgi:hypothetical protein